MPATCANTGVLSNVILRRPQPTKNLVASQQTKMRQYYVCIMTNRPRTLYIGVTNDLERRVYEHKSELAEGFTKRYRINRLVYFDTTTSVEGAITREKVIKGWRRSKKINLIEQTNPAWKDLSDAWYDAGQ